MHACLCFSVFDTAVFWSYHLMITSSHLYNLSGCLGWISLGRDRAFRHYWIIDSLPVLLVENAVPNGETGDCAEVTPVDKVVSLRTLYDVPFNLFFNLASAYLCMVLEMLLWGIFFGLPLK